MKQISIKNKFLSLTVLDFGAIIQKLTFSREDGGELPLVVGYEEPGEYLSDKRYLGACVGRYAGRISGSFTLEGKEYPLHTVAKDVHLHGGHKGFSKKYWNIDKVGEGREPFVQLSYTSQHMEEGYPGTLNVEVTYTLRDRTLVIAHKASTDRPTVLNLVNHSYFVLGDSGDVSGYRLKLHCPKYLETKENLLPTGELLHTKGSDFDFSEEREIGSLELDTPFLIDPDAPVAALLSSPDSGLKMEVMTNQAAMVIYTPPGYRGICFETQNLPDAPNIEHFPSAVLNPGEVYDNTSEFRFGLAD